MKHIKEFNSYSNSGILVGYVTNGGIGHHPAFLTPEYLKSNGFSKTDSESLAGRGMISVYGEEIDSWSKDDDNWISFTFGGSILSMPPAIAFWVIGDSPHFLSIPSQKIPDLEDLLEKNGSDAFREGDEHYEEMVSLLGQATDDDYGIYIILNPQINKVYYSDNPEQSKGYWKDGYPISLEDFSG
jgi:hypothetical protein